MNRTEKKLSDFSESLKLPDKSAIIGYALDNSCGTSEKADDLTHIVPEARHTRRPWRVFTAVAAMVAVCVGGAAILKYSLDINGNNEESPLTPASSAGETEISPAGTGVLGEIFAVSAEDCSVDIDFFVPAGYKSVSVNGCSLYYECSDYSGYIRAMLSSVSQVLLSTKDCVITEENSETGYVRVRVNFSADIFANVMDAIADKTDCSVVVGIAKTAEDGSTEQCDAYAAIDLLFNAENSVQPDIPIIRDENSVKSVYASLNDYSREKATVRIINRTDAEYCYGLSYVLETLGANNEWEAVEAKADVCIEEIAALVSPRGERLYAIDFSRFYEPLKAGHYRLVLTGAPRISSDDAPAYLTVEFALAATQAGENTNDDGDAVISEYYGLAWHVISNKSVSVACKVKYAVPIGIKGFNPTSCTVIQYGSASETLDFQINEVNSEEGFILITFSYVPATYSDYPDDFFIRFSSVLPAEFSESHYVDVNGEITLDSGETVACNLFARIDDTIDEQDIEKAAMLTLESASNTGAEIRIDAGNVDYSFGLPYVLMKLNDDNTYESVPTNGESSFIALGYIVNANTSQTRTITFTDENYGKLEPGSYLLALKEMTSGNALTNSGVATLCFEIE